uniref:BH3-interacting domain death agonist n=1 Tax=Oreochromis aureus TaxID=47969 RepID=A0A668TIF7_OREAU
MTSAINVKLYSNTIVLTFFFFLLQEIMNRLQLFLRLHERWEKSLPSLKTELVMMRGVGPDLPWERVIIALALTLVKRVCVQTPQRLRNLFHTALQYINAAWALFEMVPSGFDCLLAT